MMRATNISIRLEDMKVNAAIMLVIVAFLAAVIGAVLVRAERAAMSPEKQYPQERHRVIQEDQKKLDTFKL